MEWPNNLVRELARRRCVLFIGSGVTASADNVNTSSVGNVERPKTWSEFITSAIGLLPNDDLKNEIQNLIEKKDYLLALQAIKENTDPGDYIALLDSSYNNPCFIAGKTHKLIYELDSRIVITTNFDKLYENYCHKTVTDGSGFKNISYNDKSLGDLIRSDSRIIIKAHGSINDVNSIIFTRAQYHEAKSQYSGFYSILKALFITHTCIFIGCGMDDPDINLLLEDVKISSSAVMPHYVLTRSGSYSSIKMKDWKSTYNIRTIDYGSSFDELPIALQELVQLVNQMRQENPEA